ncbi:hypothetical protein N7508_008350, partial [Penicillium antarcticum]|uniref:uncharacterized protein n=1 Tax=Penicillium antarcticum TaxID=416450 RepID=UPI0023A747F6
MSLTDGRVSKRSHQACENCRSPKGYLSDGGRTDGRKHVAREKGRRVQLALAFTRSVNIVEMLTRWKDIPAETESWLVPHLSIIQRYAELILDSGRSITAYRGQNRIDAGEINTGTPKSFSCENIHSQAASESPPRKVHPSGLATSQENPSRLENVAAQIIPPTEVIFESFDLYRQYCHKQPLWLFDESDLLAPEIYSQEIMFGILGLALRYSNNPFVEGRVDELCQQYTEAARGIIMLKIARGGVQLSTIQSLCLIALANFIAEETNMQIGDDARMAWLHIGLATNLLKCGGLDIELHKDTRTITTEVHRKLYWSIHLLNQQYGPRNMQLDILRDIGRPRYMGVNRCSMREMGVSPPQVPEEPGGSTHIEGIWIYMVQLSTLWSEVQHYVSHCASGDPTPPWSLESGYSVIGAHLMNIETRFPTRHRWDSVRFMDHSKETIHQNRGYWSPWVYLQFTYHAIHSVLNHPFLYSWRPQQSAQLAIPNTFWKTSSELALIHTTWTVRLIDMVSEKEYQVSDPFLAHLVAISATIHLYYCRAADPSVRESAQSKLDACMTFLGALADRWPSCKVINIPRRTISINTALMWDILLQTSPRSSSNSSGAGLFDASFFQDAEEANNEKETVETEIFHHSTRTVDTSDGGQALPPYSSVAQFGPSSKDLNNDAGPIGDQVSSTMITSDEYHVPSLPETMMWPGPGFRGD